MSDGKKITKATFKSFIKKNADNLQIKFSSEFDSMDDCVRQVEDAKFSPAQKIESQNDYNFGIMGAWLVGGGRDYFSPYADSNLSGISVSNCCGSFIVAAPINAG